MNRLCYVVGYFEKRSFFENTILKSGIKFHKFVNQNEQNLVIISKTILREFGQLYPDAIEALNTWYEIVKAADWNNLAEIRQAFNSVDYVGNDRFVFNIRGNRYRLVVMIFFDIRTVYIRFIGTHNEYDKVDVSNV